MVILPPLCLLAVVFLSIPVVWVCGFCVAFFRVFCNLILCFFKIDEEEDDEDEHDDEDDETRRSLTPYKTDKL